jgi:hypothetical protein
VWEKDKLLQDGYKEFHHTRRKISVNLSSITVRGKGRMKRARGSKTPYAISFSHPPSASYNVCICNGQQARRYLATSIPHNLEANVDVWKNTSNWSGMNLFRAPLLQGNQRNNRMFGNRTVSTPYKRYYSNVSGQHYEMDKTAARKIFITSNVPIGYRPDFSNYDVLL